MVYKLLIGGGSNCDLPLMCHVYHKYMFRKECISIFVIGPIPWGHSGPLCHALSLLWTSMHRRRTTVPLATSGEWV